MGEDKGLQWEEQLNIKRLFYSIKKKLVLILILPIVLAVASGIVSFFVLKPVYEAEVSIIISKDEGGILTQSDVMMYQNLIKTYRKIAESNAVVEGALKKLNNSTTLKKLKSDRIVTGENGTQVITVSVKGNYAEEAVIKVEAMAQSFLTEAKRLLPSGHVEIMDHAVMPEGPVKPNKLLNIAFAYLIGLMIAVGLAYLFDIMDDTIKSEEDLERCVKVPVIGVIPKSADKPSLVVKNEPKSVGTEAYRTFRTNFQFLTMDRNIKKIILTSTQSGEGKTVTTGNLALSLSQTGKKVLIVDCDLRKPTINKHFNLINNSGFANVIIERMDYKKVVHEYSENLHIITAGKSLINPGELLYMEYIKPIFRSLEEEYDIILVDTPPIISVTDAQLLAAASDGVIIVLSSGESNKKLCQKALQLLNNVHANVIGVVLNKASDESRAYYGKNQYPYCDNEDDSKKGKKRLKSRLEMTEG